MRPPADWRKARFTLGIAGLTAAAWVVVSLLGLQDYAAVWGGFIPARIGGLEGDDILAPAFLTPLTSALIHIDFVHLALNLVILVFCGRSIEPILGGRGIVILYVLGAYAAAAATWLWDPAGLAPLIGASGAVSAIIGAFAILLGRNRVKAANPTVGLLLHALWLAAAWIGVQILVGLGAPEGRNIGVAAHIGGFLVGLVLAKPLLALRWRGA